MNLLITNIPPEKIKALTHILNDVIEKLSPDIRITTVETLKGKP